MDIKSQKLFEKHSADILSTAAAYFGIMPTELKRLGSFESFVFEFERGRQTYILKITHSLHRNGNQILGELDWTNYLAENGINVPRPIRLINNNWVERIDIEDSYFLIYAFNKVVGHHLAENDWNDDLFKMWGRTTGRMHALTKKYKPSSPNIRRLDVFDDGFFSWTDVDITEYKFPLVIKKCQLLIKALEQLPQDKNSFGLIHTDIHAMNFFINNSEMTVFDFDDCCYNWFAHDLAIPLFYELQSNRFEPRDKAFARRFFGYFMEGYSSENKIDAQWLEYIPLFLKMREMDLYFIIESENALNANEWCRRFMEGRREKIENDIPVIDIDFTDFAR